MLSRWWPALVLPLLFVLACSSGGSSPEPLRTQPAATATAEPSPTPAPVRRDIRATRLVIPSLNIDSEVQLSRVIPYTYSPPPGCPPRPQDTETLTVPDQGITTPADPLEGIENKAWILGHSHWLGRAGVLLALQDINLGAELFIDGFDRFTGEQITHQRYVVSAIYLADTDSGEALVNAESPADIPSKPIVILQTSVREDGVGKQWILNQQTLLAKAKNIVEGDLNDYCKYLLLFVFAEPS